jgi:hypothetical protein
MLVGRFWMIIPAHGDGRLARGKRNRACLRRHLPDHGGLFVGLLVGVILIIGGLTFFPALALGPIVEHSGDDHRHPLFGQLAAEASSMAKLDAPQAGDFGTVRSGILWSASGAAFSQARPTHAGEEPGDVRARDRHASSPSSFCCGDMVAGTDSVGFEFQIMLWLWFTVLFANFAEAIAEGRGKAQADCPARQRTETQAKLITDDAARTTTGAGTSLSVGDIVLVEAGDYIPSDGEVVEGSRRSTRRPLPANQRP